MATIALTIAGSDSGGGAGIQADLKTFAAHGVYGLSAATAITAQNTFTIESIHVLPSQIVEQQIHSVASDFNIQAIKTGMLVNSEIIETIGKCITSLPLPNVIIDPVICSTSGVRLLTEDGVKTLMDVLLPNALMVTPNIKEAEVLTGRTITSLNDTHEAACQILDMGPESVVITGESFSAKEIVDVFVSNQEIVELRGFKIDSANTHGTGCTFSAAIAAFIALGKTPLEAATCAKKYVENGIKTGLKIGHSKRPLNHF
tara:strand:+ start:2322 stop:3098 length:777 start_codon:yes stop_codon:yes gene_type:complete